MVLTRAMAAASATATDQTNPSSAAEQTKSPRQPSSKNSQRSSASLQAQRLAAKALHARRVADLEAERERAAAERERVAAERERAVADIQLQAELAALDETASEHSSFKSSMVDKWVNNTVSLNPHLSPQMECMLPAQQLSGAVNLPGTSVVCKPVLSPGAASCTAAAREHALSVAPSLACYGEHVPCVSGAAAHTAREHTPSVAPTSLACCGERVPYVSGAAALPAREHAPSVAPTSLACCGERAPYVSGAAALPAREHAPSVAPTSLACCGERAPYVSGAAALPAREHAPSVAPTSLAYCGERAPYVSGAAALPVREHVPSVAGTLLACRGERAPNMSGVAALSAREHATFVVPTIAACCGERAPNVPGAAALPACEQVPFAAGVEKRAGNECLFNACATAPLALQPTVPNVYDTNTTTHILGTHDAMFCTKNNNAHECHTSHKHPSDLHKLAEVISDLARCSSGKVRDVNLPIFSGSPTHWLTFRSSFINSKNSFTATENIGRLNNALRGAARDAVVTLLALSQDPSEIMAALQEQFGQPELLIRHMVSEVKAMPRLPTSLDGGKELHQLACTVRNCVHTIKMMNSVEFLASPEMLHNVLSKLTPLLREKWVDYAYANSMANVSKFKLELLSDFLTHQSRVHLRFGHVYDSMTCSKVIDKARTHATVNVSLEQADFTDDCYATSFNPVTQKKVPFKPTVLPSRGRCPSATPPTRNTDEPTMTPPSTASCSYCHKTGHFVSKCDKFSSLSLDDRWRWAKESKVCHRCLKRGGHFYRRCKTNCDVQGCKTRSHNTLLHTELTNSVNYSVTEPETHGVVVAHATGDGVKPSPSMLSLHSLLKVVPVTVSGPKGDINIFALLDDGSTVTMIDQTVAEAVGAQGPKGLIEVNCIGGLSKKSEVSYVDLNIKGKNSPNSFLLKGVRSVPNLGIAKQTVRTGDLTKFPHLQDLVSQLSYEDAKPMLLIGIDNWHLSLPYSIRRGLRGQPAAVETALGWTVFGRISNKPIESVHHGSVVELESLIKDHYRLDSIGITKKDVHSVNDERALKILEETTRRLPSGRFETGLLWRADINNIPNSYNLALSRFISLERKFKKDLVYAEAYRQYIDGMVQKGYAEICSSKAPSDNILWYLPHFGVYHPQKQKLRLVHDAAARCSGTSLNSLLLPGPDLLQPLLAILMRFREGKIALNGDIREMFPQTKIREKDRDAQRFLWRTDPSLPLQEFRMSSMIFGATSSPCTAIFLKDKNALEHKVNFPDAVEAIVKDHYMDDYLGSVDSPEHAARLAADIVAIHEKACLEMRSWVSNNPKALSLLKPEARAVNASEVGLGPLSPSQVRILGVAWNVNDDTINFRKTSALPLKLTKRVVLSHLMQVYDPLGFLMPVVIAGRILFQETWRMGIEWDEELPTPAKIKWQSWFASLAEVSANITIPRCYQSKAKRESQLHVLADASELAYSCVAFWRFVCDDGSVKLALIGGKARLAPLKPASIPRLELQAALMAARFATYILEAHRITASKVFFWTDSLTVLKWLRSDARTFKPFVAHRVGEILETTDLADWRYVPSALNVADDATRGQCPLSSSSRWFQGPNFLFSHPDEWPREPTNITPPVLEEIKPEHTLSLLLTERPQLPSPVVADYMYFCRWIRLVRATARAHYCAKIFRLSLNKTPNSKLRTAAPRVSSIVLKPMSSQEILEAERHLLLKSQLDSFNHEFTRLSAGLPPINQGKLKTLTLKLGEDGLIRLNGRIAAVLEVPAQDVNPIVLDGRHPIIRLLLDHYHRKFGHGNLETVVNFLRGKYYILALRPSVKSVAKQCRLCRAKKLLPTVPRFGDLPADRLAHHQRPFSFTGLDYFGPVEVAIGRRREKRWVALFTCLTTRAVHLDIVGSLSADAAIMVLRRFIARRGCPVRIVSDNGTSFVGAANQLSEVFDFAANNKIEWEFIPPAAPSMGGSWERLVRSVKAALSATTMGKAPKEEVLATLLLEAEAVVNSRPLTHVPVDPDTLQALTPFHFLLGTPSIEVLNPCADADLLRRVDYKKALRLAENFWTRWLREYLPSLIPRKTGPSRLPLQLNDPVLIVDQNLPRGTWPRGRITKIFTGPDGTARVVEVATCKGIMKRPIRKIVPLLLEQDVQLPEAR